MEEDQLTELLIEKAQQCDRPAFDELASRLRGRLEALIQSRLGPALGQRVDIADIVQESFLRAYRSIDRFERRDDEDSFFRWLGGIANHVILEAAKREKRDVIVALDEEAPSAGVSPSKAGQRGERFDRLQSSLDSLSPDHRQVILLARVERLPIKEVARKMERSPEAVTQLLWRALKKLKESFGSTDSFHLPHRRLQDRGDPHGPSETS